jgi:hypothetical protein
MKGMTMTAIYDLPENPSAMDIIQRSIVTHPTLFRDTLIKQAEMNDDYARATTNPRAMQGVRSSFNACLLVYDIIGDDELTAREAAETICAKTGTAVIALNIACKLQCLPPHIRTAAAVMLDEKTQA